MQGRSGGRSTRPKKLTPKQNVHIFREEQIDTVSADIDAVRNQVETGVEKSEESVSALICLVIYSVAFTLLTLFTRNTICSKPSRRRRPSKRTTRSRMHTYQRHLPSRVISNMTCCTRKHGSSLTRISGRRRRSKTATSSRIVWTRRTSSP